jgi:elongation factor Ts
LPRKTLNNSRRKKDMAFTAKDVKELREMTGVGMMDCKKALAASDGDMDKAVEWLREKGLAAAQKKAGRIAAEGMAYAANLNGIGVVVEVNAETDFVAKNEKFVNFVKGVAQAVAETNPADMDALMATTYPGTELTVLQQQQEMVLVIGENISVRRFARFADGFSVPYVHAGGKIGVLVNLTVEGGIDATEIGKDVAMQIAALNPRFWDKSQVSEDVLDEEKKILLAQMDNDPKMANKPAQVKEKIVVGKLNKFYTENCLLQQEFVKDNELTVEKYIASAAKALGGKVTFVDAVRFEKGEGIEKRKDNFAEEIASMVK